MKVWTICPAHLSEVQDYSAQRQSACDLRKPEA